VEEEKCDADEDGRCMGEDVYGGASVDYSLSTTAARFHHHRAKQMVKVMADRP